METERRLIDANALKAEFPVIGEFSKDLWHSATIRAAIDNAPTVDAVEVVHGRWKYYHKQNIAVCTNCSFERNLDDNFGRGVSCPNCGAKMMDGDGNG